jgi:hypothetical protein
MKTAGRKTHKRYAVVRSVPSFWSGKREQILLDNKRGWKSTKIRPKVKFFFLLTSPLIELFGRFGSIFRIAGSRGIADPTG